MEICRMDNPSHFYPGINSQQMLNSFDFGEANSSESPAFAYDKNQSQLSQNVPSGFQEYQKLGGDENWKGENVECKQEVDPSSLMINDNSNYGSESEFNESYQYAYNPTYANDPSSASSSRSLHKSSAQHRMGPYHISSSTKNQLPSWYTPPSTYYTQQPTLFQHQYPYHQGGFEGAPSTTPSDHNMRNMIQVTSRYDGLSVASSTTFIMER